VDNYCLNKYTISKTSSPTFVGFFVCKADHVYIRIDFKEKKKLFGLTPTKNYLEMVEKYKNHRRHILKINTNFILILLIILSCSLLAQTAEQPSGSGTENDPYLITNLENLYWMTENSGEWDKYYVQTSNIDASSSTAWDEGLGFIPLGNNSTKFTGSLMTAVGTPLMV